MFFFDPDGDHDANDDHGDWSPWPEPPWQLLLQQPSLFGVELAGAHLSPFGDVYKCENFSLKRVEWHKKN